MGFFQLQHVTEYYENAIERILTYDNFNRTDTGVQTPSPPPNISIYE